MSLDAWYGRVTVEQLLAAIDDRTVARALINDVLPEGRCDPAEARALSIGTTWDALAYLLEAADGPDNPSRAIYQDRPCASRVSGVDTREL